MSAGRRRFTLAALAAALARPVAALSAATGDTRSWPAWQAFRRQFVSGDGRVIDPSTPQRHTTSEGQAYALFFALVAGSRDDFAKLLAWTENNLAAGDLTQRLPAWQWGRRDDGSWQVLDANAASDADLWLAYVLGEAGRLWGIERYRSLSAQLAARVLREETALVPGLGRVLLPAPYGFGPAVQDGVMRLRLNPSYVPLPVLRWLVLRTGSPDWADVLATSVRLLTDGAPRGMAADWVQVEHDAGTLRWLAGNDPQSRIGSFNAIRVYLWMGVTAERDAALPALLQHYRPMLDHLERHGMPPLEADAATGRASGEGPPGFVAALLPFVERQGRVDLATRLGAALQASPPQPDAYYDQALTLFAVGHRDGRYRFDADGLLLPAWT